MSSQVMTIEERIVSKIDSSVAGSMELASNRNQGLAFANLGQVMEFAKVMAVSQIGIRKHLRGNVGACLAVCVQAIEWEMSPFAVANKSYLVNDQIAYEAQLIAAVALRRAPITGRFKVEYSGAGETRVCKVSAVLNDGTGSVDYESPTFARITPKNSPLWKSDPDQQQFYYSVRALCRRHFPDVLLGVYSVDELASTTIEGEPRPTAARTLSDRLDALAATPTPAHDPETGEVIEGETGAPDRTQASGAPQPEPTAQATDAPAVDKGAEASQSSQTASAPKAEEKKAAETKPPATKADAKASKPAGPTIEDKRALILADLVRQGDEAAAQGERALDMWLEELTGDEQALITAGHMKAWRNEARRAQQ